MRLVHGRGRGVQRGSCSPLNAIPRRGVWAIPSPIRRHIGRLSRFIAKTNRFSSFAFRAVPAPIYSVPLPCRKGRRSLPNSLIARRAQHLHRKSPASADARCRFTTSVASRMARVPPAASLRRSRTRCASSTSGARTATSSAVLLGRVRGSTPRADAVRPLLVRTAARAASSRRARRRACRALSPQTLRQARARCRWRASS